MRKGWFHIPGVQTGDRTIEQQLKGLGPLMLEVPRKRVLDLGCAEGLIADQLLGVGAESVHGVEIVAEHVQVARHHVAARHGEHRALFHQGCVQKFLDDTEHALRYDIVLALAIFHKLKDPARAARIAAERAGSLCVVRLPPQTAPVVVDARSGHVPHDIEAAMRQGGLRLAEVHRGHLDEWVGYFRRSA